MEWLDAAKIQRKALFQPALLQNLTYFDNCAFDDNLGNFYDEIKSTAEDLER